uniref:Uncharacterized protein n=1 Tax=Rhizophora mucronata TaxID=61149 RepID=A0A2P2PKS5_RHIMU
MQVPCICAFSANKMNVHHTFHQYLCFIVPEFS